MGLLVDPRAGSERLVAPLLARGLPVTVERLSSADVAWIGRGVGGAPTAVGVEYKTISEILQCIQTGRFADAQLPLLQEEYAQAWILIEGEWKSGKAGELLVRGWDRQRGRPGWIAPGYGQRGGTWMLAEVEHWLMTIHTRGGISVARARNLTASAEWLHLCYAWWTSKDLDEHKSHLRLFDGQPLSQRVSNEEISYSMRLAAQLPGLGSEGAWAAVKEFRTVEGMVTASPSQWSALMVGRKKPRRLGEATGKRVWEALHQ